MDGGKDSSSFVCSSTKKYYCFLLMEAPKVSHSVIVNKTSFHSIVSLVNGSLCVPQYKVSDWTHSLCES